MILLVALMRLSISLPALPTREPTARLRPRHPPRLRIKPQPPSHVPTKHFSAHKSLAMPRSRTPRRRQRPHVRLRHASQHLSLQRDKLNMSVEAPRPTAIITMLAMAPDTEEHTEEDTEEQPDSEERPDTDTAAIKHVNHLALAIKDPHRNRQHEPPTRTSARYHYGVGYYKLFFTFSRVYISYVIAICCWV
jgi:hypothetical protein